jgi:hypothetical protein
VPVPTPEHIKSAVRAWHAAWLPYRDADPHATGQLLPDGHSALERIEDVLRALVATYGEAATGSREPGLPDRAIHEAREHRRLSDRALSELYFGLDRLIQRNPHGSKRSAICEPLLHDLATERIDSFEQDPITEVFKCITQGLRLAAKVLRRKDEKDAQKHAELPETGVDAGSGPIARGGGVRSEGSTFFVASNHLEYFDMAVKTGTLSDNLQLDLGLVLLRESAKYPDAIARFGAAGIENAYPHLMALKVRGLAANKSLGLWIEWFQNQDRVEECEEKIQAICQRGERAHAAGRDLFPGEWLLGALRDQGFDPRWDRINNLDQAVSRARDSLERWILENLGPDGGQR